MLGFFFFSRTCRRAAYVCIKRVKQWSNYNEQHLTLDQSECCRDLIIELLQKIEKQGPDNAQPAKPKPELSPAWLQCSKPLAPENCHSWDSSLCFHRVQAFLCFHRVQAPRTHRELKSFLCCFGTFFQDLHHSAKELMLQLSIRWARFRGCRTENQNCRVNTQEVRMCWTVSSAWSQRGHRSGWGGYAWFHLYGLKYAVAC